jgi:hypothetical protein
VVGSVTSAIVMRLSRWGRCVERFWTLNRVSLACSQEDGRQ